MALLKILSNFRENSSISIINCETKLVLAWSAKSFKLVPTITRMKLGFKRTIN